VLLLACDYAYEDTFVDNITPTPENEAAALTPKPPIKNDEVVVLKRTTLNYVVIAITFFLLGMGLGGVYFGSSGSMDEAAVSAVVRDLLVEAGLVHPIVDNMYSLVDDDPFIGEQDAPIIIVEFSAYACPYCGQHFSTTFEPLLENYGQLIRYVYRDHPIINQDFSFAASIAANCALEQNKFWEFHGLVFENQQSIGTTFFLQTAEDLGMDVEQFTECYQTGRYADEVMNDTNEATALNITGTPAFYINGTFHSGARSYEYFESIILQELEKLNINPVYEG
jgi:protein-disulfide isomerase